MTVNRLEQQITFVMELDKLKSVIRQTRLVNGKRKENTAEHSWHAALAALVLAEYADEPVDVLRVAKMLLVHDIIEIDAGDTYAFDDAANVDKAEREQQAAARLFGLLPDDQGAELRALWDEFEAMTTPDAKFANAIDQIMPLLHNMHGVGGSWLEHNPPLEKVLARTERRIKPISAELWAYTQALLMRANQAGWLSSSSAAGSNAVSPR